MEERAAAIRDGNGARAGVAGRASAALHGRHERPADGSDRRPSDSRSSRPGAAANTPITGPASALPMSCSTSSGGARTCAPSWRRWKTGSSRALASFNVKGERREDRVGVWVVRPDKPPLAGRLARRGQDRGDRHPAAALGELSRHRPQRRAGPFAFRRHRAVRRRRPWRHQPRRSRPAGDDGRCRPSRCGPRSPAMFGAVAEG